MIAAAKPTPKTGVGMGGPVIYQPDNYGKDMGAYRQYQESRGYSPQQIQAMSSPWSAGHSNAATEAEWMRNHPGDLDRAAHSVDPNVVANGIQYAAYVPGWNTSMSMSDKYQNRVDANSQGFNSMRDTALSKAPSAWANAERMRQAELSKQAKDTGAQTVAASTAGASDALAAGGGISSGARERIAEGGAKNLVGMNQDIQAAALNNNLQVGTTDEANKLSMLSGVVNEEKNRSNSWMQAHQADLGAQTAENERVSAYNQHLIDQKNAAYAAQQQANATRNSGK